MHVYSESSLVCSRLASVRLVCSCHVGSMRVLRDVPANEEPYLQAFGQRGWWVASGTQRVFVPTADLRAVFPPPNPPYPAGGRVVGRVTHPVHGDMFSFCSDGSVVATSVVAGRRELALQDTVLPHIQFETDYVVPGTRLLSGVRLGRCFLTATIVPQAPSSSSHKTTCWPPCRRLVAAV